MKFTELFEDYTADFEYRNKSNKIWDNALNLIYDKTLKNSVNNTIKISALFNKIIEQKRIKIFYDNNRSLYLYFKYSDHMHGNFGEIPNTTDSGIILYFNNDYPEYIRKNKFKSFMNEYFKSIFIHECIHYFDFIRSINYNYDKMMTNINNNPDSIYNIYYNNAMEFNAHYQQILNEYIKLYENGKLSKPKSFNDFFYDILELKFGNIFDINFMISYLNEKYQKKLVKRLYIFYDNFFKDIHNDIDKK